MEWNTWSRRGVLVAGGGIMGGLAGCLTQIEETVHLPDIHPMYAEATLYQGPACECCNTYGEWLSDRGVAVETEVVDNTELVKQEFGLDTSLWSCHTVVYDGYIVEGHIPTDGLRELGRTEPNADGIALPGMPAGTPGMGGRKTEDYTIYQFSDDEYEPFTVI